MEKKVKKGEQRRKSKQEREIKGKQTVICRTNRGNTDKSKNTEESV